MPPAPSVPRRVRLTGTVRVPVAGARAFHLFTPLGEKLWAADWNPLFAEPPEDDSAPGTVFETEHDGMRATWVVCRRDLARGIQYARVIPGQSAGTITVSLAAHPDGSLATVEYDLTALTGAGAAELAAFASRYPRFLAHWETAIAEVCSRHL